MGMAKSATIYHGTFTPEGDITEYVIDVGKQVHVIIVQVIGATLVSGRRNFGNAIMLEDEDGNVDEYGLASNANGTTWGTWYWTERNPEAALLITKSGTEYTLHANRVGGGAKLLSGVSYEWYAY